MTATIRLTPTQEKNRENFYLAERLEIYMQLVYLLGKIRNAPIEATPELKKLITAKGLEPDILDAITSLLQHQSVPIAAWALCNSFFRR